MTKQRWPKFVNISENTINITTTTNLYGWIWLKIENKINIITTMNIDGWIWLKIQALCWSLYHFIFYFSVIFNPLMFVVVVIFIIFSIFSHIHPYFDQVHRLMFVGEKFRSCSNVKVPHCEIFSVKF